jgi:hypothetical protein
MGARSINGGTMSPDVKRRRLGGRRIEVNEPQHNAALLREIQLLTAQNSKQAEEIYDLRSRLNDSEGYRRRGDAVLNDLRQRYDNLLQRLGNFRQELEEARAEKMRELELMEAQMRERSKRGPRAAWQQLRLCEHLLALPTQDLTVAEIAEQTGISERTIYRLLARLRR